MWFPIRASFIVNLTISRTDILKNYMDVIIGVYSYIGILRPAQTPGQSFRCRPGLGTCGLDQQKYSQDTHYQYFILHTIPHTSHCIEKLTKDNDRMSRTAADRLFDLP